MNFLRLLSEIEQVDPDVYGRLDSRRRVFRHLGGWGQRLSAAALPLAVGALFQKAYAQTPAGAGVNDVLNFALKLEYLESYFYNARSAAVTAGLSAANVAALNLIATDERNHVGFLRGVLGSAAIADPTAAQFDFSAGGRFADWNTNVNTYLALAQSFEDTGVRAYKGGAPLLMSNKTVLTAALNIHSVEARHAARLRAMRRAGANSPTPAAQGLPVAPYGAAPKSWVSGTDDGGAVKGFTEAVYGAGNNANAPAGVTFSAEDSLTQADINLVTNTTVAGFPTAAFSEAFDEGLDVSTVAKIAKNFVVPSSTLFNY